MKELGIDIETYSGADLAKCGVHRYVEDPGFAVLLFCYSVDHGPVQCVDFASGQSLPGAVRNALTNPRVRKTAFNATFERVCLSKYLGRADYLDPAQWDCTMVAAARAGLPLALGQCAEALGLPDGKMSEGRALIRFFSKPDPRTGRRHLPDEDPEKWETFKAYCVRDVEVEQAVLARVRWLRMPVRERELYACDQRINDRGVLIDRELAGNAVDYDRQRRAELTSEAIALTGLDNPNSPAQLKAWLGKVTGTPATTLNKKSLEDMEDALRLYPAAARMLAIRKELAKTSNAKYGAMLECVCSDGRIRGLLQFYGAARTGRWAGRLVQVQNLPQNHLSDLGYARRLVQWGDYDEFRDNYAKPTQVLSELIRTAFVAPEGCNFHVCDFSAIEARVIAWLAHEDWVLDVFRGGGDIYCATASQMFGVPVEKHGANADLRQKGKVAVLALGYGGGAAALEAMGGKRLGLTEAEEREIVELWRRSNPRIVALWSALERSAIAAIRSGLEIRVGHNIIMCHRHGCLLVYLPSGRCLCYPEARVLNDTDERGRLRDCILYKGVNQVTRQWDTLRTYGGKLTENVVQAVARDILGEVLLKAEAAGFRVVFHIHDEIVVEVPKSQSLAEVQALFDAAPEWAPGLPLKGAAYATPFYLKD